VKKYCGRHFVFFCFVALLLASCTAKRYVPKGKYLVRKNSIHIESEKDVEFSKSDLSSYAPQRPNKSFLGTRFSLWTYYVTEKRTDKKFWKWINETIGTEPVYADKETTQSGAAQMERYLNNIGYFHSKVKGSIETKKITADIIYRINPKIPYRISEFKYTIYDTIVESYVNEIKGNSKIRIGAIYNAYLMDDERTAITEHLKNNGYYFFTRDYIYFEVDSSHQNHTLKINLIIDNAKEQKSGKRVPHKRYFINRVNVFPNYNALFVTEKITDSGYLQIKKGKQLHELYFYSIGDPRIRKQTFSQTVLIKNGEPFSQNRVSQTYRTLGNYRIYNSVNIDFDTIPSVRIDSNNVQHLLNCNIMLYRAKVHDHIEQIEGTNSGGDLGIRGSFTYGNKNIFRGGEVFRIRIKGGIEAQKIWNVMGQNDQRYSMFNTTELGIDASVLFPRFLSPIPLRNFRREYQPKTNLTIGYNAQTRSHYSRTILAMQFGYDWMASSTIQHIFSPFSLNSVKVNPSDEFRKILDEETNIRVKDQYTNHLLLSLNYSFIFNNQNINKLKDFFYFRANIETSGNAMSLFNSAMKKNDDYFELFGIRYAQFVRTDFDFRYYHLIARENWFVIRTFFGIGMPYGNSKDMPFERSFYAGGSNGMRGWRFRELGPGSFNGSINTERIGDIQIEFNAEYRFPIYGFIKGALFVDVGNIWTKNDNSYLPGGKFEFNSFYKELAMDVGLGFRFDFSFFIFRIDAAAPIRNPEFPENNRWIADKLKPNDIVWNFGIGYPF
jgi:outer membrane protein assembly factor BamA